MGLIKDTQCLIYQDSLFAWIDFSDDVGHFNIPRQLEILVVSSTPGNSYICSLCVNQLLCVVYV
jgi:hypothetical protein